MHTPVTPRAALARLVRICEAYNPRLPMGQGFAAEFTAARCEAQHALNAPEELGVIAAGRIKTALAWLLDCESKPQEKIQAATRALRLFGMDEAQPLAHVAD